MKKIAKLSEGQNPDARFAFNLDVGGTVEISPDEVMRLWNAREQAALLCSLEAHYWAAVTDERIQEFSRGSMASASNLCAAILMGTSAEDFEKRIFAREQHGVVVRLPDESDRDFFARIGNYE